MDSTFQPTTMIPTQGGFTVQPRWRLSFPEAPGPEPLPRARTTKLRLLALGGWRVGEVLHGATCHSAFSVGPVSAQAAIARPDAACVAPST